MRAWRLVGVIYAGALVGGLLAYSGVLLAGEGPIVAEGVMLPSGRVEAVQHSRCVLDWKKSHWWSQARLELVCGVPMRSPSARPTPAGSVLENPTLCRSLGHGMEVWEPCGPTPSLFWLSIAAQAGAVFTQEYAYAKFGVYGANKGQRALSAGLNFAPVILTYFTRRQAPRSSSNVLVAPSIPWGLYGTAKNVYDIRKIDALLRRVREAR